MKKKQAVKYGSRSQIHKDILLERSKVNKEKFLHQRSFEQQSKIKNQINKRDFCDVIINQQITLKLNSSTKKCVSNGF